MAWAWPLRWRTYGRWFELQISDVERTCDYFAILRQGSIVFSESMAQFPCEADEWEIEVLAWTDAARQAAADAAVREEP